ncbi:MAG: SHOCT domain-containing protein [Burkholderiales bacterium]
MNAKLALAAMVMAGALAACSSKPTGPRVDVTIGQQLIELKEAHDSGALTDKEYDRQRKRLIEGVK